MKSGDRKSLKPAAKPRDYYRKLTGDFHFQKVADDFFGTIDELEFYSIADFLSAAARISHNQGRQIIVAQNLQNLCRKMEALFAGEVSLHDLSVALNALSKLGYLKESFSENLAAKIVKIINANLDKSSTSDICNVVNSLARLGFDKGEVQSLDLRKLAGQINQNISSFAPLDTVTLLRGLAQMGFIEGENVNELNQAVKKLALNSQRQIAALDHRGLATLVHSLARLEMFDELFLLQPEIFRAFSDEKISQMSQESIASMVQAETLCALLCGEKFFSDELVDKISRRFVAQNEEISALQDRVAQNLPTASKAVTRHESSIYAIGSSQAVSRQIDILHQTPTANFFIEVDGTKYHRYTFEGKSYLNSATKQRDRVNEAAIAQFAKTSTKECYYLKISEREIEANRGDLRNFLLNDKLRKAKRIRPEYLKKDEVVEPLEAVLEIEEIALEEIDLVRSPPITTLGEVIENLKNTNSRKSVRNLAAESMTKFGKTLLQAVMESDDLSADERQNLFDKLTRMKQGAVANLDRIDVLLHCAVRKNEADIVGKIFATGLANEWSDFVFETALRGEKDSVLEVVLKSGKVSLSKVLELKAAALSEKSKELISGFEKENSLAQRLIAACLGSADFSETRAKSFVDKPYANELFLRAQAQGRHDITSELIKAGLPFLVDPNQMLEEAIVTGHNDMVNALLARGVDASEYVHLAIAQNPQNFEIISALIDAGADVSAVREADALLQNLITHKKAKAAAKLVKFSSLPLENILKKAVELSSLELVEAVTIDPRFDASHKDSAATLAKAINAQNWPICDALVRGGVVGVGKAKVQAGKKEELLVACLFSQFLETFSRLYEKNFFSGLNKNQILALAIDIADDTKMVQKIVESGGVDLNQEVVLPQQEGSSTTPLVRAIRKDNLPMVRFLLGSGANPNATSVVVERRMKSLRFYPLHSAATFGNAEIVQCLIERGANPNNALDGYGTALETACAARHFEVVKTLVDKGALFEVGGRNIFLVLLNHPEAIKSNIKVAQFLIERGAPFPNVLADRSFPNDFFTTALLGDCWELLPAFAARKSELGITDKNMQMFFSNLNNGEREKTVEMLVRHRLVSLDGTDSGQRNWAEILRSPEGVKNVGLQAAVNEMYPEEVRLLKKKIEESSVLPSSIVRSSFSTKKVEEETKRKR
ncbi:MAG: ankyrin repeat domain-containing protein [Rickettsiales bacterium]|nr:ankyrin repeat domain-containing protein [Rickettsiales bacterium]